MSYEHIDISGDAGVRASGATLVEAFEQAALGMYALVVDPGSVNEVKEESIHVESHSIEGLLVSWLNELVYRLDAHGFLGRSVCVTGLDEHGFVVDALIKGEEFDPCRHEGGLLIKAATYHGLKVENLEGGWKVEVMFDI